LPRLLHLPPDEEPSEGVVLDLLDDVDRESLSADLARCAEDGTPFDVTVRIELADGAGSIHTRIIGEPVRDPDGRIIGLEGAILDITAEVEARAERERLETRLRQSLDGLSDAMAFVDRDWTITYVNVKAADLLGTRPQALIGKSLWELELDDPEGEAMLRAVMLTGRTLTRRRFAEDMQRWVELTAFPAGDLMGIQIRDVTEAEDARQRMFDDSRRIHAQTTLLDSPSDAILMRGLSGVIEYANRAASELLGGDELLGRSLTEALSLDAGTAREIEQSIGRTGRWEGDLTLPRADGPRVVESRWQVVDDLEGNPDAVFCSMTDVTERRKQDEILTRTQRMESIGTLASGIAHDLNNVLTPLLLSTQLLASDESDPQRQRILAGMQQTIERGGDMIRQVLTFARGVEGERTIVSVAALAKGFAEFCRDTLPKTIEVEVAADDDLFVLGDPTQLLQVLMNLATNSRDAMPSGGSIRLRATGDDERIAIEVADDGSGMTPDVLARIWEPFFTTKGLGRGTGLGLPVSQAIARTHGGSLEATSTPGTGTVFRLELPRVAENADGDDASSAEELPDLTGLRVLIVDDEHEIVELASLVISGAGGAPMAANDARHAQELLRGTTMDVVLTDLVMPGFTGRAFLDWLAEHHPALPVVTMTGVPEQGAHAAQRGNVLGSLDKPFTAERLVRTLATASRVSS